MTLDQKPAEYRNQHVVTESILRRWADPETGQVEVFLKETGDVDLCGTKRVCSMDYFIRAEPKEAEAHWRRYEDRLRYFFEALDAGDIHSKERAVGTARWILALHVARSFTMRELFERAESAAKNQIARKLVQEQRLALERSLRARPFYVPITQATLLAEARRHVDRLSDPLKVGGPAFGQRLYEYLRIARSIVDRQPGLEVLVPKGPHAEFVIGDAPVLLPADDLSGRFGLLEGVRLDEAATFVMPFGPRHAIASGPVDRWTELEDEFVEWTNAHQVRQSYKHVVTRPGSGLAHWATTKAA